MEVNDKLKNILEEIKCLEEKVASEVHEKKKEFQYNVERGKVVFKKEIREKHHELKSHLLLYLAKAKLTSYLVAPIIYAQIIPFLFIDLFITVYQWINFPVYKIDKVNRQDYIVFDRHKLAYLNTLEKINCLYCSYVNGLIGYAREVASRTEQYFCPIRHARKQLGTHGRYYLFTDYGDAESYKNKLIEIRESLREHKGSGENYPENKQVS